MYILRIHDYMLIEVYLNHSILGYLLEKKEDRYKKKSIIFGRCITVSMNMVEVLEKK